MLVSAVAGRARNGRAARESIARASASLVVFMVVLIMVVGSVDKSVATIVGCCADLAQRTYLGRVQNAHSMIDETPANWVRPFAKSASLLSTR